MRIFGKRDFGERLLDLFEGFEPVDLAAHVTAEDLAAGAIPVSALTSPTGHSVFLFRKRSLGRPRRALRIAGLPRLARFAKGSGPIDRRARG